METETTASSSSSNRQTSQMLYKIHPLVIMNISEHWTRMKAQKKEKLPIIGAMLGVQDGRNIELQNSFDVLFELSASNIPIINEEYFRTRGAQFKEVFPELELLGWYTVGGAEPTDGDKAVHRQFSQWMDAPLLAKMDASQAGVSQKVPLFLFECTATESSQSVQQLLPVEWLLVSEESERIGIDHITRLSTQTEEKVETELYKQLRSAGSATNMLQKRLEVIRQYVLAVQEARLPSNSDLLREASRLCHQLPFVEIDNFEEHFAAEHLDADVVVLVTEMTSLCGALTQLVSKMNVLALERVTAAAQPPSGSGPKGRLRQQLHQQNQPPSHSSNAVDLNF